MRHFIRLLGGSSAELFEVAAAICLVVGFTLWLGAAAGFLAAGVALLGKSLERDMIKRAGERQ